MSLLIYRLSGNWDQSQLRFRQQRQKLEDKEIIHWVRKQISGSAKCAKQL